MLSSWEANITETASLSVNSGGADVSPVVNLAPDSPPPTPRPPPTSPLRLEALGNLPDWHSLGGATPVPHLGVPGLASKTAGHPGTFDYLGRT